MGRQCQAGSLTGMVISKVEQVTETLPVELRVLKTGKAIHFLS